MDISADKYNSNGNRPSPFLVVLHNLQDIVGWLIGFLTLTEEDRLKAGINFGDEGRDD